MKRVYTMLCLAGVLAFSVAPSFALEAETTSNVPGLGWLLWMTGVVFVALVGFVIFFRENDNSNAS